MIAPVATCIRMVPTVQKQERGLSAADGNIAPDCTVGSSGARSRPLFPSGKR